MGSLLAITIQPLEGSLIVEMNIGQHTALREIKWCDAAKRKAHGQSKE
jgi:hypothetical protein